MKNVLLAIVGLLLLSGLGYYYFADKDTALEDVVVGSEKVMADQKEEGKNTDKPESGDTKTFTLEEVEKHSEVGDCWLVLDGKVYDVTEFINSHPGGEAILQGCGKDATELFETRPMGSGTAHSLRARSIREQYYIGDFE
jgi:cytochrome b involved in lipid metabolism